jgi:RNA polymerase sigma factor (sigma-70 family)
MRETPVSVTRPHGDAVFSMIQGKFAERSRLWHEAVLVMPSATGLIIVCRILSGVTVFSSSLVLIPVRQQTKEMPARLIMVDDDGLKEWFCREVLPLERSLTHFIRRNWRAIDDVTDIRQDIYQQALSAAHRGLPLHTRAYVFAIARNHLINRAKRAKIVSFDLVADLEGVGIEADLSETDRGLEARDELRRAMEGIEALPPRCREVVRLRKVEGYSTREVADQLGVGVDTVEKQMTIGMRALVDFMLGGSGKIQRPVFRRKAREESRP